MISKIGRSSTSRMGLWWSTPGHATNSLTAHDSLRQNDDAAATEITNHIRDSVDILARHPFAGRQMERVSGTREGSFRARLSWSPTDRKERCAHFEFFTRAGMAGGI